MGPPSFFFCRRRRAQHGIRGARAAGRAGACRSSLDKTDASEPASEVAIEVPPAEEPPPIDFSTMVTPIELVPSPEPPPVDFSELKPVEPPKPPPSPAATTTAKATSGTARRRRKAAPSQNFRQRGCCAQQAAAGFRRRPPVVWKANRAIVIRRRRHAYPPRAVELNQQGEVLVRVRLDPAGHGGRDRACTGRAATRCSTAPPLRP